MLTKCFQISESNQTAKTGVKLESTADKLFIHQAAAYKAQVTAAVWNKFSSKQVHRAHIMVNVLHMQKKQQRKKRNKMHTQNVLKCQKQRLDLFTCR